MQPPACCSEPHVMPWPSHPGGSSIDYVACYSIPAASAMQTSAGLGQFNRQKRRPVAHIHVRQGAAGGLPAIGLAVLPDHAAGPIQSSQHETDERALWQWRKTQKLAADHVSDSANGAWTDELLRRGGGGQVYEWHQALARPDAVAAGPCRRQLRHITPATASI